MPQNKIAYQEWLPTDASIFQCGRLPDSPIFSSDAPAVKGLVIYAARCGVLKFYAAWVRTESLPADRRFAQFHPPPAPV